MSDGPTGGMDPDEKVRDWIRFLHHESTSSEGFFLQPRYGDFNADRVEEICQKLESMELPKDGPSDRMIEREFVSLLWYLPHFLNGQAERVERKGGDVLLYRRMVRRVTDAVFKILNGPFFPRPQ